MEGLKRWTDHKRTVKKSWNQSLLIRFRHKRSVVRVHPWKRILSMNRWLKLTGVPKDGHIQEHLHVSGLTGKPLSGMVVYAPLQHSNLVRAQCRKSVAKILRSSVMKRILTSRRASSSRQLGQHWMATSQVCQYTCFSHKMAEILWIFVVCTT